MPGLGFYFSNCMLDFVFAELRSYCDTRALVFPRAEDYDFLNVISTIPVHLSPVSGIGAIQTVQWECYYGFLSFRQCNI